jgi:hypothetical protein
MLRKPKLTATPRLRNHLPAERPVVHKAHAFTAVMIFVVEVTVHAMELPTIAFTVIIGTFGKDIWEAIDICWSECSADAEREIKKVEKDR